MSGDGEHYWHLNKVTSYRTVSNIFINSDVYQQIFGGVKTYIGRQEWHNKTGIPWNYGLLLHGPPGTGKTSIIKALASLYNISIYIINLGDLEHLSNADKIFADLMKLLPKGQPHIFAIEDVDRSDFFSADQYKTCKLRTPAFLNALDGIHETHGRITIFTCNDMNKIINHPIQKALLRPGRIDEIIEISAMTPQTAANMVTFFYPELEILPEIVRPGINAWELSKHLRLHIDDPTEVVKWISVKK